MPAAKAKSTAKKGGGRSTTRKPTASRSKTSTQRQARQALPMVGLVLLGLGIFFFFCVVTPSNAVAIVAIRSFVNGWFGRMGIPAMVLMIYGGLQLALGDRWPLRRVVWVQAALLVFCLATLLQVFQTDNMMLALRANGYRQNYNGFLWQSYEASRNVPVGGGSVGALLAYPMGRYLDILGSALVLILAMLALALWVLRTLVPTAGERLGDWFTAWRDDFMERREERAAQREAERLEMEAAEADDGLLVPLPAELLASDAQDAPEPIRRVARGRKKKNTAYGAIPNRPEPVPLAPKRQQESYVYEPEPAYDEAQWQQEPPAGAPQPTSRPQPQPTRQPQQARRPQPAPQPVPARSQRRPTRAAGAARPRLYIENDVPIGVPQVDAVTELDAERVKYATRPSRKEDPIPDFILKRRQEYDAQYGPIHSISGFARQSTQDVPAEEPLHAAMPADPQPTPQMEPPDAPAWDAAPIFEEGGGVAQDAPAPEQPTAPDWLDPWVEDLSGEEPPAPFEEAAPAQDAYAADDAPAPEVMGALYRIGDPADRVPELDPAQRLDHKDWQPPEPEAAPDAAAVAEQVYRKPPFSLLERDERRMRLDTSEADAIGAAKLEETLLSFGVSANVMKVVHGPAITRYELQPAPGVKVSKIVNLTDDIALNMAAVGVRIEAPIPGKAAIGIEIANDEIQTVHLRDVLESEESQRNPSKLAVALGKDIAGKRIIADLARMPHLLIAGATGAGKSVCINTLISSIIYRATPEQVRLILIDPKKVELAVYNGIPHLLVPVVTDPKKASGALHWAVAEMDERYKLFADIGVRDIKGYNAHRPDDAPLMPQIVVIIDELSDLMLVAPGEVEESICRLAQLARACGIHLVIATQRPSVNVITGIIKANIPSRIAFAVSSQVDSRTILDSAGAEKLLGKGDMLFAPSGGGKPLRVQGCFVSDEEVQRVVEYVKDRHTTDYSQAVIDALDKPEEAAAQQVEDSADDCDALFVDAVEMAIESGQASISMLQRRLRVGYARAGRIVDEMSKRGIIGLADGAKPREVLMTREQFEAQYRG